MDPQKSAEFPGSKPLPPIGSSCSESQEVDKKSSDTEHSKRASDDRRSSSSSTAFDRQGEGSARPNIVRGFRPEPISDDDMGDCESPRIETRRKTYDGREIHFITLDTQTDWDWVEEVEHLGTGRTLGSAAAEKEEKDKTDTPKSLPSRQETADDKTPADLYQYQMPYNDEYGIPILDLSSDTDDSSDDEISHKKIKDKRKFIPSIGPPNILQYQRESEKHEMSAEDPQARMTEEEYEKDEQGMTHGLFSGACEFCNKEVKPFPTIEQQQMYPPESLYCCSDYQEFVEFVMLTNNEMEETVNRKNKLINVKPHEHVGSKQERNAAKEKAVQRMRERELQRRQQEASGLQQNFFACDEDKGARAKAHGTHGASGTQGALGTHGHGPSGTQGASGTHGPSGTQSASGTHGPSGTQVELGTHGPSGNQGASGTHMLSGTLGTLETPRSSHDQHWAPDSQDRAHRPSGSQGTHGKPGSHSTHGGPRASKASGAQGQGQAQTASGEIIVIPPLVARQMKTINYQLSSQKCLEEGWTLRAPSPLFDEFGDEVFVPEPLNPDMLEDGKDKPLAYRPDSAALQKLLRERPLIEKFYESGQKFLTMFPDGTGNVFYPSGNLAILISAVKLGQYFYTIHHDIKRSDVAAAFEPNGYGYCYFPNGAVRLYIDQYGGLELDATGGKRRKWSWKDQITHIHAPPFQPICIGLNRNMGVRVMSQENIALTFSSSQRSCRFNMGARLKIVAPENAPLKEIEENHIFLEEKKNQVDAILDKVSNLLKFPNHPKLDKMLPPLHISSKATKTEKLKKERQVFLAQQSERDKKQAPVPVS